MSIDIDAPAAVAPTGDRSRARQGTWGAFLARRLGRLAISIVVLVTVSFLMVRMIPGDPIRNALGINAPQSVVDAKREAMGLNLPLWQQYVDFWLGLLTGDLGESFSLQVPVTTIIAQRLPATLELAILALVVTLVVAVPLGIVVAGLTRGGRRRGFDFGYTTLSGLFAVIPEFLIGVGLVYVFAVATHLLPVAGRSGPESYILPVLALSIGGIAGLSRIVRTEALTVLEQDYVRTARSKRMPRLRLYVRHALPNLLTSALTIGGLILGALIAGTVLVETIFAWPGLGLTIVDSIRTKDFPLAQGVVIVYGLIVLLVTLIVDVVLVVLDPRSAMKEA
ncbi:ABC transporter permease [Microbacterium immunditiarum]|uniref:Peptide/nickel transport system permease protein n=1 Tax=Microbacterium immunditiarum TaxID=337480 RepID=A0A7Y9KGE8_9MICO|nr:ABC transporter permease [Microbacterium immunditiarum]NYE18382.1 peptide/nickel transport system permease protein [Microbacterium immunditiarum]